MPSWAGMSDSLIRRSTLTDRKFATILWWVITILGTSRIPHFIRPISAGIPGLGGQLNGLRLLAALAPAPIVATAIASGGFGDACLGGFADQILTIDNSGFSELLISKMSVSPSVDFALPSVSSYPLAVSPGGSIDVVIRFQPSSFLPSTRSATITIVSNELFSPHTLTVLGLSESRDSFWGSPIVVISAMRVSVLS